ncbi:MAG: elongation factor Ts, partial [Candidatus Omnitrophica bacterium]|nr:elongation factor Ts [Candidatus Omnitrophota bacterium]
MSVGDIKKLREMTLVGINECKEALKQAHGDFDKALKVLREKGAQVMEKKSSRATRQGLIEAYVHFGGNLGALVEINCETDFVARTEAFKKFAKDLSMHIAAINPSYIKREDIPADVASKLEGIDEYAKEHCLLEQLYVKDNAITIGDYLKDMISKTGE